MSQRRRLSPNSIARCRFHVRVLQSHYQCRLRHVQCLIVRTVDGVSCDPYTLQRAACSTPGCLTESAELLPPQLPSPPPPPAVSQVFGEDVPFSYTPTPAGRSGPVLPQRVYGTTAAAAAATSTTSNTFACLPHTVGQYVPRHKRSCTATCRCSSSSKCQHNGPLLPNFPIRRAAEGLTHHRAMTFQHIMLHILVLNIRMCPCTGPGPTILRSRAICISNLWRTQPAGHGTYRPGKNDDPVHL